VHPPVDIPPRKGIARRGAGRLSRGGGRVRPGGAMGKGYIARGHRPVAGSQLDEKVESTRAGKAISDWQSVECALRCIRCMLRGAWWSAVAGTRPSEFLANIASVHTQLCS
jgi:hypothetical protein